MFFSAHASKQCNDDDQESSQAHSARFSKGSVHVRKLIIQARGASPLFEAFEHEDFEFAILLADREGGEKQISVLTTDLHRNDVNLFARLLFPGLDLPVLDGADIHFFDPAELFD